MSDMVFCEGHVVQSVHERVVGSLVIELSEDPQIAARCGRSGDPYVLLHERRWRRVRERDWFDRRVWLDVLVRRMDCHHCGARVTERIAWLSGQARITRRLAAWVEALVQLLPIVHVPRLTGLHWHTIKEIDRLRLEAGHGQFEAHGARRMVMDAETMRVIWVGEEHSREAIHPFFALLAEEGCRRIEAVAMDMNTAFDLGVRQHCPQAEVVYDLFHVVAALRARDH